MRIFAYINLLLIGFLGISLFLFWPVCSKNKEMSFDGNDFSQNKEYHLPKNPFSQFVQKDLAKMEEMGAWDLDWQAPSLLLPNLKQEIQFLGKNLRPDAKEGKARFTIALKHNDVAKEVVNKEKIYLQYTSSGSYIFSESPTALWLQMSPLSSDASGSEYLEVKVFLAGEDKKLITIPAANHQFTLKAEEKRPAHSNWEIGGVRVDTSLLLRQGARLSGKDLFFEMHGGNEYKETAIRERLDFLASEQPYFCFVKEGDFLIWKNGQWQNPKENESTEKYPLLCVKKMDEKAIFFDLWDVEGKVKVPITLIKSKLYEPPLDVSQEFKFVGAKTWIECIVECRGKRLVLREGDWILLSQDGWKKMSSEQEVDDYVNQKISGPLFILDKITKKNNRTAILGHIFNSLRTSVSEVELTSQENILKTDLE